MRFDILLAMISSGLYAPLLLMAFGFMLAVGGAIYLWQRRRKTKQAASGKIDSGSFDEEPSFESAGTQIEKRFEHSESEAVPAPVGRRRRSLVGGAERDEGTPTGALRGDAQEQDAIEEADFSDYVEVEDAEAIDTNGEDTPFVDAGLETPSDTDFEVSEEELLDDAELGAEHEHSLTDTDTDLDAQWIEADDETGLGAGVAGSMAGIGTAGAMALGADMEASEEGTSSYDDQNPALTTEVEEAVATEVTAEIVAALKRPITFRQTLPQSPGKDGLSFFGGEPIGPEDFQWPRERGAQGGAPLQFVMQWDCAQLAEADPTGLLPQDGVLYCFVNFERDDDEDFLSSHQFIHHRGQVRSWGPIETPKDAGPALGSHLGFALSGCTEKLENARDHVPRVLPRFPFAPIAFNYPLSDGDERVFWSDKKAASALLEVQQSGVSIKKIEDETATPCDDLARPFPAFPHDFGAVRIIASRMIEALHNPDEFLAETLYPTLSQEERDEQFAGWCDEAKEVYLLGTQRPANQKLEQNIADDIWQWFDDRKGILDAELLELVEEAVDMSLGETSEALGSIPAHWIDRAMHRHALATEYAVETGGENHSNVHAPTPARMFGPASFGPASFDERNFGTESDSADATAPLSHDHLLLLELPSGSGPGHHFGGRILQYWITPDNLAAGSFNKVKAVTLEAPNS